MLKSPFRGRSIKYMYVCMYLTICLSFCLSVCLSVCRSVFPFVCLSILLFLPCWLVRLSVCLFVFLSVCLFVCLSVCLSDHPCVSCLLVKLKKFEVSIDQFRYIQIQSQTIDLRTWLWGINPTNSVFIPQSLVMRSIV